MTEDNSDPDKPEMYAMGEDGEMYEPSELEQDIMAALAMLEDEVTQRTGREHSFVFLMADMDDHAVQVFSSMPVLSTVNIMRFGLITVAQSVQDDSLLAAMQEKQDEPTHH